VNFTQPEFLILFSLFLPIYFMLRRRLRAQTLVLTIASYIFYAWFDWRFLGLLLLSTIVDFYFAIVIDYAKHSEKQPYPINVAKCTLWASVAYNLAVLGFFKYFDFFMGSLQVMLDRLGLHESLPILQIVLPAGISFYTFQSLSYVIDVYDGKLRATNRLADYAAYISFFPHLVSGPILRGAYLMPKIVHERKMSLPLALSGLQLALWGYFTKLVLADNMASIVNRIFLNPSPHGAGVIIATYAFAFQIYGDFMGYTNIARGISRMMGFELVLNFNLPYFAANPGDFWRRWHISLSSWLRDYLYIRLGGNRNGRLQTYRNLLITMILGGLWHGAAWNFIIWGAYHGVLLAIHRAFRDGKRALAAAAANQEGARLLNGLKIVCFFQLTCIGWLIFRARGFHDIVAKFKAVLLYTKLDDFWSPEAGQLLAFVVPFLAFEVYQYLTGDLEPWRRWPGAVRILWYVALLVLIAILVPEVQTPFIYFQF